MPSGNRERLLRQLDHQVHYLGSLTTWARAHPSDTDALPHVLHAVSALCETLRRLDVSDAVARALSLADVTNISQTNQRSVR